MNAGFYICGAVAFACLLGLGVSAVLIDHGMISRLAWDLFCVVGLVFAVPALIFAWGADQ